MIYLIEFVLAIFMIRERELWRGPERSPRQKQARAFNTMKVIAYLAVAFIIICLASAAFAQTTNRTYQDQMGRQTGTSVTNGNTTTFSDQLGRNTGRAVTNGNTTTIYNPLGQVQGTIRSTK